MGLLGTLFVCLQFSNQISSLIHLMAFQSNGKGNLWIQAGAALSDTSCPGLTFSIREGVKKNRFFFGNSHKQRTPPTHPYGLGLT